MSPEATGLTIAGAFLLLWFGRILYFRGRLRRSHALFDLYNAYAAADEGGTPDRDTLTRRTREVHDLWRGADIEDGAIAYTRFVGFGRVASGHYSTRDNWTTLNKDVAAWVWNAFNRTIGHYEDRSREAFNPVHTIVGILTAPQSLVRWLGIGPGTGTPSKVVSLLWATFLVVAAVMAFLGVSLKDFGLDITRLRW